MRILVINPGSTSTKVAVFDDETPYIVSTIRHTLEELQPFKLAIEQHDFRKNIMLKWLEENNIALEFDAIIGRGSLSKPIPGGVYEVNRKMIYDTYNALRHHACNLGCIIAYELARMQHAPCKAFIADPGAVDEMVPEARISGSPMMPRICLWHALNQRAISRRYARSIGKKYEELDLIVCHLGGGISVAAHCHGRAIDANNALDGEGPFSPERAGSLPCADLIHLCFSGKYTEEQLKHHITGKAGIMAHLGTTDIPEVLRRIERGDVHAKLILDAMIFHTAKAIASEGAVLRGHVDAILLTGGMAHAEYITSRIAERVEFIAPVHIFPGEDEMSALALNALAVLRGEIKAQEYS